jgi:hypothetical protein
MNGIIHLYTYINKDSHIIVITISSDKIASVIVLNDINKQQESIQTWELKSLWINMHNCVAIYSRYIATISIQLHCLSTKVYLEFQKHKIKPYSPKQCLLNDWDKFQDFIKQLEGCKQPLYQDSTMTLNVKHKKIIDNIKMTIQQSNIGTINYTPASLFPQLIIDGVTIDNKHIATIRKKSRKNDVKTYSMGSAFPCGIHKIDLKMFGVQLFLV